jgi:ABC-type glucose/galactose transport system permease subunit
MATVPADGLVDRPRMGRSRVRTVLYCGLHFTGFLGTTMLITWGLFVLFFLAIGSFSIDGMMHQLNNLAARYVAADADRVTSFKFLIIAAHTILSAGVIFFRRNAMFPSDLLEGDPNDE